MTTNFRALRGNKTDKYLDGAAVAGPQPTLRAAPGLACNPVARSDMSGRTTWFVLALRHSAVAWRVDTDLAA